MLPSRYTWLNSLQGAQLSKLAGAIGVASSGRKAAVAQGIREALIEAENSNGRDAVHKPQHHHEGGSKMEKHTIAAENFTGQIQRSSPKSILSIDMGIRSLAYAHLTLPPVSPLKPLSTSSPTLSAWRTVIISPRPTSPAMPTSSTSASTPNTSPSDSPLPRESFSPTVYAAHAYSLLTKLLTTNLISPKPTHLLIEQQRFRSAGSAAVTNWALRVGVFEGMLHAVAETLKRERGLDLTVAAVDPKRVVGYWLPGPNGENESEELKAELAKKEKGKRTTREVKKAKIEVLRRWLEDVGGHSDVLAVSSSQLAAIAPGVQPTVDAYLLKSASPSKARRSSTRHKKAEALPVHISMTSDPEIIKLDKVDDLADSMLQGVAWLRWRQTRVRIAAVAAHRDHVDEKLGSELRDLLTELGCVPSG